MFRFWVFTIPGPKGTFYVPSGILTGASSECLLEFDTGSNPLGHHGWICSHGYCTQFCSILPFEGQGKCSLVVISLFWRENCLRVRMRVRVNWKIFYWKRNMHADTQKMDVVLSWLVVLDRIYKLSSLDYILDQITICDNRVLTNKHG